MKIEEQKLTRIIEVAKFIVKPGREDALVREHGPALEAVRRAFPGLLRVRLVHMGGSEWADVAEWSDEESADAAKEGAMRIPEFAAWTRHIADDLSLDHGEVKSLVEGDHATAYSHAAK